MLFLVLMPPFPSHLEHTTGLHVPAAQVQLSSPGPGGAQLSHAGVGLWYEHAPRVSCVPGVARLRAWVQTVLRNYTQPRVSSVGQLNE